MKGELFEFTDWDLGRLEDYPTVFSAGNVVTGKGNIVASRKHAREITQQVAEAFLGLAEGDDDALLEGARAAAKEQGESIAKAIARAPEITAEQLEEVRSRVKARQQAVDYPGDYHAWLEKAGPPV